ncbi:MAG: fibronectin type III domain-containing protein, partial [Candidatus Lokiarchaeota archaeon]|nr:fibronectin type III domain-containing protein [Candidatus Lokiarchaeota archaeon]
GATWDELVTDLDDTHYEWDLFSETPGDNYRIKVIANSTGGLSNEDVSGVFSIIEHVLSQVVLAYPIGGEEYVDSVTITWSECVDNWNYSVFYDLYKSSDGGATWVDIMTNVQDTHYKWSILYEAGGNNYRVKVVANSTGGLSTEDVSGVFSIREHYLSQVELTHPTGGEKIVDSVDITWTECVDSEGYSVSYDLHVSSDGGATWAVLMEDVQDTHYKWNVVSEPAGNNYVIKVIANTTIGLSNEDVSEAFSIAKRTDDLSGILGTVGIIAIIAAIVGAAVVTGFITNKKRKNAKLIRYKKTLDSRLVNLSGTLNKNPPKPKKPIKPKESTNQ